MPGVFTTMPSGIEAFYDTFSERLYEDVIRGNLRVYQQFMFLARSIPSNVSGILIVGCGSGQIAHFLATRVAAKARILAIDMSAHNLRLATTLFPHRRVEYRKADILTDPVTGKFDAIVLPDVYEHIERSSRKTLHSKLNDLLDRQGSIFISVPSPGHQAFLAESGHGLQPVDEVVTLDDLVTVAMDVGAVVTYYSMMSVGNTNDYIHAIIERGAERIAPLDTQRKLPIKGWNARTQLHRAWSRLLRGLGVPRIRRYRFDRMLHKASRTA